jgi:hypothetical protein
MAVKINIEGEGLSFEAETDIVRAAQIIAFVKVENTSGRERQGVLLGGAVSATSSSPGLALAQSAAKANVQRIAVLGQYICNRDQSSTFSAREVQELMKRAGVPLPKNFSRDLKDTVRANFIYEEGEGQYSLTEFGVQSIQQKFANSDEVPASASRKKRNGGAGKRVLSEQVQNLVIDVNGNGKGPDYWNLTNKGQRVLWILKKANDLGVDGLSTSEIETLGLRVRDRIEAKNVMSLTSGMVKKGFMTQIQGKYRILQKGIDFIEKWKNTDE